MRTHLIIITIALSTTACSQQSSSSSFGETKAVASQSTLLKSLRPMAGKNSTASGSNKDTQIITETNDKNLSDSSSKTLVAPAAEDDNKLNSDDLPTLDTTATPDSNLSNKIDGISKQVQTSVESNLIANSGGSGNGLVPPPPAVTLSNPGPPMPPGGGYPYPNPYYYNPYAQIPQQQIPPQEAHPQGSFFGNINRTGSVETMVKSAIPQNKHKEFVPINPVGMEARSAYKQRDDMCTLWKGFLNTAAISSYLSQDKRAQAIISQIQIALPAQSTRGNFSVSPGIVNQYFKASSIQDKKLEPYIKKWETDIVTAYNRYLYTYNKFALAEQSLQARNQEFDVAESDSEKQRAATDLSTAKNELNSTKEDMKASQIELAQVAGINAAKLVIQRISGISPQLETTSSIAESTIPNTSDTVLQSTTKNVFGSVSSIIHHNKRNKQNANLKEDNDASQSSKESFIQQNNNNTTAVSNNNNTPTNSADDSGINFQLKTVNITPRKSVLTVSIRNTSQTNLTLSPDDVYVCEGNQKLPDAVVRADFNSTSISPNCETQAIVTIFGRPWNDRLNVILSKDGKNITLNR